MNMFTQNVKFCKSRLFLADLLWHAWDSRFCGAHERQFSYRPCSSADYGAGLWLAVRISFHSSASPDVEAMHRRVVFDAIGILVGTIVGYRMLVDFVLTEGIATVRMQTELALAHGIQATLVPTLSSQVDRFEVYGKSIPSAEMGGDLIDTLERDGTLLAYVADISGHGPAAGQLMGMLKTAIRVALQFRQQPVAIMESAGPRASRGQGVEYVRDARASVLRRVVRRGVFAGGPSADPALSRADPGCRPACHGAVSLGRDARGALFERARYLNEK